MSTQPITYTEILDGFREIKDILRENAERMAETDRLIKGNAERMAETDRQIKGIAESQAETDRQIKATNVKIGSLDSRVGEMIEKLVGEGNLVSQFRELGFKVKTHSRHKVFGEKGTAESGEIDLFMEDGDVSILVEAKTTLKMDHVIDHIERMEKYRRFVDADGSNGKRYIGAVAGTVIAENVINFAHENGMYVIIQSARAVEILAQPEGFKAKEW